MTLTWKDVPKESLRQEPVKAHVTRDIFAHKIEIKRYCDKNLKR